MFFSSFFTGFVHFTFESRLRIFSVIEKGTTWETSKKLCSNKSESLVTVYDVDDINFMLGFVSALSGPYVGLHWTNRSVKWSDGTPSIFKLSTENQANGKLECVSIDKGNWTTFNCADKKHFMCYDGKFQQTFLFFILLMLHSFSRR